MRTRRAWAMGGSTSERAGLALHSQKGNTQLKVHLGGCSRWSTWRWIAASRGKATSTSSPMTAAARNGSPFVTALLDGSAALATTETSRWSGGHLAGGGRPSVGGGSGGRIVDERGRSRGDRHPCEARGGFARGAGMKYARGRRSASPLERRLVVEPDGRGLVAWLGRYLEALRVKNYSPRTVVDRERHLLTFFSWCEARNVRRPEEVTKPMVDRYQRHLFHYRSASGKPLTFRSQTAALTTLRGYFKWLARTNVLLWSPASDLELPRPETRRRWRSC